LKKSGQLKSVQDIVCQICEINEHSTTDCPTLPSFKKCLHEQAHALNSFQRPNHNPFSQTSYAPPPRRNLKETLHAFIEKQETNNTQLAQSMTDFKDTLAKFTSALSF